MTKLCQFGGNLWLLQRLSLPANAVDERHTYTRPQASPDGAGTGAAAGAGKTNSRLGAVWHLPLQTAAAY